MRIPRALVAVAAFAIAAFYGQSLSAKTVPLTNAGFENGTLYQSPVEGWTYGSNESGVVFKEDRYGHSEGSYMASFNQSGWIYQNSGHALLASRTYVLSVDL